MTAKLRYILITGVLLSLLTAGIVYLVSGSSRQVPDSPTATNVDGPVGVGSRPLLKDSSTDPVVPIDTFSLELIEPVSLDLVVKESPIMVKGRTRIDALVTVNDYVVEPDIEGRFRQEVNLTLGLNTIEIIASVASGEQKSIVLGVGYILE